MTTASEAQRRKAERFRTLHQESETFIMPNAWSPGSAALLAEEGFSALGTTSAGIAYALGQPDYAGAVNRETMLKAVAAIAAAVDLPVSADLEAGYGLEPEAVAETIRQAIAAGVVGGNIEDHDSEGAQPLIDRDLAVARIRAARQAADESGLALTLTGRTDVYLLDCPNPFAEAVERANRFLEAGADCVFVPGLADAAGIGQLVREVAGPVNVVMGLAGGQLTRAELADLGVRRISIGGSLARATFGLIRAAAREMAEQGTFGYARHQIPDRELSAFFAGRNADLPRC